jgi:hypothetical protein
VEQRGQARDRHGRVWTASVLLETEAEEADFRFWYDDLTPEQRVRAVEDCLLSTLKTRGIREIPRLRRVYRIVKPKWCQVSDR